jgi:hypothetical protein
MLRKSADFLFPVPEGNQAGFFYPASWALFVLFVLLSEARVLHHL